MKKYIIAFDVSNFSESAFQYANWINQQEKILLTGIFIPQISFANLWSYTGAMGSEVIIPMLQRDDEDKIQTNIDRFIQLCQENSIEFKVHKDYFDFALPELKKETRFADVLLLSADVFYDHSAAGKLPEHIKDALHSSECPVIVIPEKQVLPDTIILAYDGSSSSVYAIKQFAYLFPFLTSNRALLVSSLKDGNELPDKNNIAELVSQHYANYTEIILDKEQNDFRSWVHGNSSAILVSGSFGRSAISQVLKESFVNKIIGDQRIPVFIAHK